MTFAYTRVATAADAATALSDERFSLPVLKAGGMDLVDHIKEGLMAPDYVIDVRGLRTAMGPGTIPATMTLAEISESREIAQRAPVLAHACGSAATPHVRNVASAAGNILQRPRCWYYRNATFNCLKKGGHKCYAVEGDNHYHAVFGDGPCYIVHPSNLAVALAVLDAKVHVQRGDASHAIAIGDFFHLPLDGLRSEHNLEAHDVVTHIEYSAAPASGFHAIKHKQSFDWPLVMAAVALDLDGDVIRAARVCAGAVAPIPWRLPAVEAALKGVRVRDGSAIDKACAASRDGARPLSQNGYKLHLLPVALRRALMEAVEAGT